MIARTLSKLGLIAAALVGALALQGMFAFGSSAHSVLLSSIPADGQVVASAPDSIRLQFSEAVDPSSTRATITDSHGHDYVPVSATLVGEATLVVRLPHLPAETYRVSWRTVAADDRHQTTGVVVFGVQSPARVSRSFAADPLPSLSETLLRWLTLVGLSALAGGLLLGWLPRFGRFRLSPRFDKTLTQVGVGGGLLALAAMLALALDEAGGPAALAGLFSAPFGRRSIVRIIATAALVGAAAVSRRMLTTAARRCLIAAIELVALAVAVTSTALLGHQAGSPGRVIVDSVHLTFALVWCGSLLGSALTMAALYRRRGVGETNRELRQLLAAFGVIAIGSVAMLAITGVLLTAGAAQTVDALLLSTYGHVLAVKLALALIGGLLGWSAHRRLRRSHPSLSARALLLEAVILVLTVGGGAALAGTTPAQGAQWRPAVPVAGSVTISGETAGLVESVRVSPNRPGRNFVTVAVFDTRRPALAPIKQVWIDISGPDGEHAQLPATSSAGQWVLPTDVLDAAGQWSIGVRIVRAAEPSASATYPWSVAGSTGGPARPVVSQAAVSTVAYPVAAALAGMLSLGALVALVRRRRGARRHVVSSSPEDDPAWSEAIAARQPV